MARIFARGSGASRQLRSIYDLSPAEARYYRLAGTAGSGPRSLVAWDGTGRRRMNQWVTVEALAVLRAAGRSVGLVGTSS
jgi:hypothetical protein